MERFQKIIIVFNYFAKNSILSVWEDSEYVFWIFANFRKYNKILNIRRDETIEGFWIFQDSEYTKFLRMQVLFKVLNMSKYAWIMPYDRVNEPQVVNMPGFWN